MQELATHPHFTLRKVAGLPPKRQRRTVTRKNELAWEMLTVFNQF
jgi:hypothetical protein